MYQPMLTMPGIEDCWNDKNNRFSTFIWTLTSAALAVDDDDSDTELAKIKSSLAEALITPRIWIEDMRLRLGIKNHYPQCSFLGWEWATVGGEAPIVAANTAIPAHAC